MYHDIQEPMMDAAQSQLGGNPFASLVDRTAASTGKFSLSLCTNSLFFCLNGNPTYLLLLLFFFFNSIKDNFSEMWLSLLRI